MEIHYRTNTKTLTTDNDTPIQQDPTFWDFGLHPLVEDGLEAMNFEKPSPVQAAAIPLILEGKDLIACAQTGTGKTAAYLLPILSELATGEYPEDHVNAIIMSPTRELAQQIDQQIDAFSYFVGASAVPIYGGTGGIEWEVQKRALKMGADIIVATPGRLIAHLNMSSIDLSRTSFFVLDEADRMLDMGFYDDILEIYKYLPQDVQVVMFSATMPPKIRTLAKKIAHHPAEVNIAISRPPESILQQSIRCKNDDKMALLTRVLLDEKPDKCIVFFASKDRVKQARRDLKTQGLKVREMHSDLDQESRDEVMHGFKNGHTNIIVATDILSRGIDVDDIDLVVNFDVPADPEDYVHRIGRTARGKNLRGSALTFISSRDKERFDAIERFLGYEVKPHPLQPEQTSEEPRQKDRPQRKKRQPRNRKDAKDSKGRDDSASKKPRNSKSGNRKPRNRRGKSNRPDKNTNQPSK